MARLHLFAFLSLLFLPTITQAAEPTVLLFGDSIVAGYGLSENESLSVVLEADLRKQGVTAHIINGGVSGNTTGAGRERLSAALAQYNPDIVVLALGANDMLHGVPLATTRENLDVMLKELTSDSRRRVILSRVLAADNNGAAYRSEFDQLYPTLASQYNVALFPFLLEYTYGKPGLMLADGVHPSAKGVIAISDALSQYLRTYYLGQ